MTTETQWITVKQYMDIMPISKPHVYRMIKENKIPHTRVGRKILIHHDAIHHIQSLRKKRINIMPEELQLILAKVQSLMLELNREHYQRREELVTIIADLIELKKQYEQGEFN